MQTHEQLGEASERSRKFQNAIRRETFAPEQTKSLRRFSSWEATELILRVNAKTFAKKIRQEDGMPDGVVENESGGMRWFTLDELNTIRSLWRERGRSTLKPLKPKDKRAVRVAVANFKGGAGKSTTALHLAHAAALDGYRILIVDFDPQATITHAMGLTDVTEEQTVWGIIARDLVRETKRANLLRARARSSEPQLSVPGSIEEVGIDVMRPEHFIAPTCWSSIDIIGSCANAAFVEFATGEYRMANREWSFFAAVDRYLRSYADDNYDIIIFDCPPAIGYQSLAAVYAADVLYIPTGPGYWEYDSTTSFMGQLKEALGEIAISYGRRPEFEDKLPKAFNAIRVVMTRYEPSNPLHASMLKGLRRVFPEWMTEHPIELTRAVEQTGRFLQSVYEMDYRKMTRETWKRARSSFDQAYVEFRSVVHSTWQELPEKAGSRDPKDPKLEEAV